MQIEIPQIYWHDNSAPIMSIDFYPNSNYFVTSSLVSENDTGLRVSTNFNQFINISSTNLLI